MLRYIITEAASAVAVGKFNTGDTVTIQVWKKSTGLAETLTSAACTEIGTTGYFRWSWSSLTTAPTAFTEYLWEMDNGTGAQQAAEVVFGGYPDTLVASVTALTGANPVTINVQETDTTPIASVKVSIYAAADTTFSTPLGTGQTNASGVFSFTMDDGAYKVRLAKLQVNFAASEDLTVSGSTTDTYNGTVLTIPVSGEADVCRVYQYARTQSGTSPSQSLDATAQIKSLPHVSAAGYHVGDKIQATFNTQDGLFYWDLPYGAVVFFKAASYDINSTHTIPSTAQVALDTLT
jgi:hypothetical protein